MGEELGDEEDEEEEAEEEDAATPSTGLCSSTIALAMGEGRRLGKEGRWLLQEVHARGVMRRRCGKLQSSHRGGWAERQMRCGAAADYSCGETSTRNGMEVVVGSSVVVVVRSGETETEVVCRSIPQSSWTCTFLSSLPLLSASAASPPLHSSTTSALLSTHSLSLSSSLSLSPHLSPALTFTCCHR